MSPGLRDYDSGRRHVVATERLWIGVNDLARLHWRIHRKLAGSKSRKLASSRQDAPSIIPTEQGRSKRPAPDGQEARKPGVSHGALVGPGAIFQALFGQQFLIS